MGIDTIYYDGWCGWCRPGSRALIALDWCGNLRAVDMMSVPAEALPVPFEMAMRGMPMMTGEGRVHVGFPAFRRALMRTPLGAMIAWPLYLPMVSLIGRGVYRVIANNRPRCRVDLALPRGA